MNKSELVESVQKKMGGDVSKAHAERAVDAVIDSIKAAVQAAGKAVKGDTDEQVALQLVGFGTFSVVKRAARTGVNPRNPGEKIKIKASKAVKFKPGQALKASV